MSLHQSVYTHGTLWLKLWRNTLTPVSLYTWNALTWAVPQHINTNQFRHIVCLDLSVIQHIDTSLHIWYPLTWAVPQHIDTNQFRHIVCLDLAVVQHINTSQFTQMVRFDLGYGTTHWYQSVYTHGTLWLGLCHNTLTPVSLHTWYAFTRVVAWYAFTWVVAQHINTSQFIHMVDFDLGYGTAHWQQSVYTHGALSLGLWHNTLTPVSLYTW